METSTDARPWVLLVEDDATTRAVLVRMLERLPLRVDAACDVASALARAAGRRHALWLLDAHLPDGSGIGLLAHLRRLHGGTPALAHTASDDPALARRLVDAGFADVLVKPVAAMRLQEAVGSALGRAVPCPDASPSSLLPIGGEPPVLDDAAALAALGDAAHVAMLRALFAAELAAFALPTGRDPAVDWQALHRLQAACGFIGAVRLAQAAAALQAQAGPASRARFERVLRDTHAALQACTDAAP